MRFRALFEKRASETDRIQLEPRVAVSGSIAWHY